LKAWRTNQVGGFNQNRNLTFILLSTGANVYRRFFAGLSGDTRTSPTNVLRSEDSASPRTDLILRIHDRTLERRLQKRSSIRVGYRLPFAL
jgi:hypothetical protein